MSDQTSRMAPPRPRSTRNNPVTLTQHRRRGSAYVMVLIVSSIVITIGISASTLARITTESTALSNNWLEAQVLAFSAIEHASATLQSSSDWRTAYTHDTTAATISLGNGTFTWKLQDTIDTDLANNTSDPFMIIGTGTVGQAVYILSVQGSGDGTAGITFDTTSWKRVVN